jgi:photosystem II stability/assembly factor-like uncharacterized protein
MQSRNTLCGRSPAHIIACALVVAAIGWTILPSWAQTRGNLDSHLKRAPFDENAWRASQRAREQHIRTWGFAPGQQAQPLPNSLPVTRWSSIGPLRISHGTDLFAAGRLNSIAIHPTNTNIIYVGAADGGVWKTTDGGGIWAPLTDDQCSLHIGSVAIDPVNPSIIYAGTGDPRGVVVPFNVGSGGCGILRSTDGGTSWALVADSTAFTAPEVEKLVIDPATAGSTTTTKIFAATTNRGLLRSIDGGSTWTQVLSIGSARHASDIVIDPSNSQIVLAAIHTQSNNSDAGIYKSTDGGATFPTKLAGGFPTTNVGRIKLDIAASSPSTMFAAVEDLSNRGLLGIFKSTNSGANWSAVTASGVVGADKLDYKLTLNVDPTNANIVYFGVTRLNKSIDGGATFTDITDSTHVDFHAFAFQPGNSSTIYAGNDGGIYRSTDRGVTWSTLNLSLAITQFVPGGALHPSNPNIAIGGTQDNGTIKYSGFAVWDEVLCGDGGFNAIDQSTPSTYYVACANSGPTVFRSDNSGGSWAEKNTGINPNDSAIFPALAMSPSNSQTLYFSTGNKVYKTTDRGEHWTPSGTTIGAQAIAPAPSDANVIYIITGQGLFKSTDANATYTQIISSDLPAFVPNSLAVHPADPSTAFVGIGGPFSGAIYKTTDGGAHWTDISGNLPAIPVTAIVVDPSAPTSKLLVGTWLGVYSTIDGGATWAPTAIGMPNVVVTDLKYNPATATLIALTFGRGAWKATLAGGVATHDFNGDARSDIAWRHSSGVVAVWLMDGAQVVQSGKIADVPASWQIVGQRDFNGDAKHDFLWRDTHGTVAIWLLSGLQVLQSRSFGSVDSSWTIVGTADFNGDGDGDILWRNSNGAVAVWQMQGLQITQTAGFGIVPTDWVIAGTGDFNGDRKADILWRNSSSGLVAIWFLNGLQVVSSGGIAVVPTSWSIAGTGDFDGDGKSDILWRENGTGNIAVWLLKRPAGRQ